MTNNGNGIAGLANYSHEWYANGFALCPCASAQALQRRSPYGRFGTLLCTTARSEVAGLKWIQPLPGCARVAPRPSLT